MSGPTTAGMFNQRAFGSGRATRSALGGRHRLGIVAACATLLATAPLAPIFDGWSWLVRGALVVTAVAASAILARRFRAPVPVQVLAMLGGLLLALTWLFRGGGALLGVLPTPATLAHFGDLLGRLPQLTRSEAMPVPAVEPFLFVTALGIGLVAILVDVCAVGLRRPAMAGLPMLAVYSVPVAVMFDSVPWLTFAVGVVGYLWLLTTDNLERVRRFGRRFAGDGRDVDLWEPSPLAAAGRRLAVIGVVLAVALPVAVPGVTTGLIDRFGPGLSGSGGSGDGPGAAVNLFAALDGLLNRDETIDMLEVSTDDPDPHYLRIGVADQITPDGFDHRRPRGTPVTEGVTSPPPRDGVTPHPHQAQVSVLAGYSMPRLPAYPDLRSITGLDDNWYHDPDQQVVFATEGDSGGQQYTFTFSRPEFDPDSLRRAPPPRPDSEQAAFAGIPRDLREERVSQLVSDVTEGVNNSYDQVLAIHGYFSSRNGFAYSLETGDATTGSAIVDFLLEHKRGYCVQYAAGMAWMVRELGMPARVAIGFTSGRTRTTGAYTLTNHNAHAWTEVYFRGIGWVPFDATPRASVGGSVSPEWAPDPDAPPELDPDDPALPDPGAPSDPGDPLTEDPAFGDDGGDISGAATPEPTGPPLRWLLLGAAAVVLVLLLSLAPLATRVWRRRVRLRPAPDGSHRRSAHAAWDELLDTMIDFGTPLNPAESPRVTAARLVREYRLDDAAPAARDAVTLLGHAEERARYARTPLSPEPLLPALRAVRRVVAQRSARGTRLRATLLPPSVLARWRRVTGEAATAVNAVLSRGGELLGRISPSRLLRSP